MLNWAILTSILFSAPTLITALSLLILSTYHMTNDDNRFPIEAVDNWRHYLTHAIPISVIIILFSGFTSWVVTKPKSPYLAFAVVFLHFCAVVTSIVYIVLLANELEKIETPSDVLKTRAVQQITDHVHHNPRDRNWIPNWLAHVQKETPNCCGILGYQDYEDFWPDNSQQVAPSCCRSTTRCITDFALIEWPEKTTDYIKNDEGCSAAIISTASRKVKESMKLFIVLTVLLTLAILGFALQYTREIFTKATKPNNQSGLSVNNCFASACPNFWQRFCPTRRQFCNVDANGNLLIDPNNPLLNPCEDPCVDLNDQTTYSYTYIQRLTNAQQIMDAQQQQQQQPIIPFQNQGVRNSTMTGNPATNLNNQKQNNSQGPMFTYQVIQATADPFFLPGTSSPNKAPMGITSSGNVARLGGGGIGVTSSGNIPRQGGIGPIGVNSGGMVVGGNNPNVNFPDDSEKQNLRQLLRFGRRNRRNRNTDFDPNLQ